jgi:hypothetical protein
MGFLKQLHLVIKYSKGNTNNLEDMLSLLVVDSYYLPHLEVLFLAMFGTHFLMGGVGGFSPHI